VSDTSWVRCYAVRRVNPFLGVLQVLESEDGRACSANGVVWDIEPVTRIQDGWGSLSRDETRLAYYRYGLWSQEEGLADRPLASHFDNAALRDQAERLIGCVRDRLERLPFALEDQRELWLFDQDERTPLALLASVADNQPPPSPEPRRWAASIGADGVAGQRRFPRADALAETVKRRAGFNIKKHWVRRRADGSGMDERSGELLAAELFPPFLLSEHWSDGSDAALAAEFIDWTAPSLLTLQHLNDTQRRRLEQALPLQARSVEHHWRLYPRIIDRATLTRTRVQCRLQNTLRPPRS